MKTLRDRALDSLLHSRFVAREDDLGHKLTDDEVRAEAKYQLDDLPFKGFEEAELRKAQRQMKALLKRYKA